MRKNRIAYLPRAPDDKFIRGLAVENRVHTKPREERTGTYWQYNLALPFCMYHWRRSSKFKIIVKCKRESHFPSPPCSKGRFHFQTDSELYPFAINAVSYYQIVTLLQIEISVLIEMSNLNHTFIVTLNLLISSFLSKFSRFKLLFVELQYRARFH